MSTGRLSLILLYHRVTALDADPFQIAVTPEHFAQQMQVVAEIGTLTTSEAAGVTRGGRQGVAVTFDDGYRDNLVHALPALESADVPATIYVTTGPIGTARAFWWDELASLILQAGLDREEIFTRWRAMRRLPEADREAAMHEVRALTGHASPLDYDDDDRVMNHDELREIGGHPLITLGAHTVTHPVLSSLSVADQRDEITGSRDQLQEIIGRPVTSFAYPFGRPAVDHDRRTRKLVADAGFESACAVLDRELTARSSAFALPRWAPPNVDGEEFRTMLLQRLQPPAPASRLRRAVRERLQARAER